MPGSRQNNIPNSYNSIFELKLEGSLSAAVETPRHKQNSSQSYFRSLRTTALHLVANIDDSASLMSSKSSPRGTRKRLRQSTLTGLAPEGDGKVRRLGNEVMEQRGSWEQRKGLMVFEPHSWKPEKISELFGKDGLIKVAAFDLDSTLITTKTRAKFPKTAHDWKFAFNRVANILATLAGEGCVIVIFTNQAGVNNGRINESFVQARLDGIMAAVKADIGVFVATGKDNYRKPATGMWEEFVERIGGMNCIDFKNSFYVGDAAGRSARPGSPKDFSDSDLRFSINIDLPFRTPEEYFCGKKNEAVSTKTVNGFDPRGFIQGKSGSTVIDDNTVIDELLRTIVTPSDIVNDLILGSSDEGELPALQTMVIMHGLPASGKTSFVKRHLVSRGYAWINQDTMQTFSRCARATRENLARGKSVVIDNTNPDHRARAKYIDIGKSHDVDLKIVALSMTTPKEVAQHLNVVRERQSDGNVPHVPVVAYHTYLKRATEPELSERIDRTAHVKFLPCFVSEQERYMFTRLT